MILPFGITPKAYAAPVEAGKKAILIVSFGTTFDDARKADIEATENKIKKAYPDYEVRRAFTSRIVMKRLADRGINIDNEAQALEKLQREGFKEVIVQPLHFQPGSEYEKITRAVSIFNHKKAFEKITVGRPLLYYFGQEENPDDYAILINALATQFPKLGKNDGIILMGHSGPHPSNAAYAMLQMKLWDSGYKNVFIITVDGYPYLEDVMPKLKANNIKKVTLMPLMVVAGDHANNDMAGDEEDSYKSQLVKAGYQVETYMRGVGANAAVQNIYVQHAGDAMKGEEE
ncbi:MAG: sirohydrochlorin cobaltochelatase [Sporomusaceae bacterium]|nr:sirohydrochlorin cobaltochelatase [Sporomusaceae bacterium]